MPNFATNLTLMRCSKYLQLLLPLLR